MRHLADRPAGHSIEYRPKEAEDRKTFGHWELDTVKGGKDASTECLLTMTERKSRNETARKMPYAKAESTVEVLDEIERKIGSDEFRRIFKTMTCDGGSEFMDIEGSERSCIDGRPRTRLYFAHPYTACEHGTDENHNRMLRRFFLKGCGFSKITDEEVARAEFWMNSCPRRIHDGPPCHDIQKLPQFLTEMRGINLYKVQKCCAPLHCIYMHPAAYICGALKTVDVLVKFLKCFGQKHLRFSGKTIQDFRQNTTAFYQKTAVFLTKMPDDFERMHIYAVLETGAATS